MDSKSTSLLDYGRTYGLDILVLNGYFYVNKKSKVNGIKLISKEYSTK